VESNLCPGCKAKPGPLSGGGWIYGCGSFRTVTNQFQQTVACRDSEKDQRITALAEENAKLKDLCGQIYNTLGTRIMFDVLLPDWPVLAEQIRKDIELVVFNQEPTDAQ